MGPDAAVAVLAQIAALSAHVGELRDAVVLGPTWAGEPLLREAPIEVELDCTRAVEACAFTVRVRVTTRDRRAAAGAFWVGGARDAAVEVDRVPSRPLDASPTDLERGEGRGARTPSAASPGALDVALPFVVPPCARCAEGDPHEIVVRGRVRLAARGRTAPERVASSCAVEARHPFLGASAPRLSASVIAVSPVRAIDAVRSADGLSHHGVVVARAPRAWDVEGRGDRACPQAVTGIASCGAPDVTDHEQDGERVRVGLASPLGTHMVLGARVSAPPEPTSVTSGGAFLGLGGALGKDSGFRARVGYELGIGTTGAFLGSLAVESDVSRSLVVVPMLLVGTQQRSARPSLGFGVGAPVRVAPDVLVGPRLRLDAKWFGVGVAADFDVRVSPSFGATLGLLAEIGL